MKTAAARKNKSIQRWRVLHVDLWLYVDATLSHARVGTDPDRKDLIATALRAIVHWNRRARKRFD